MQAGKEEGLHHLDPSSFTKPGTYEFLTELWMYSADFTHTEDPTCDPDTKYSVNSEFFRSPEFEQVDLITLGCSQTFGQGVDDEVIWPKLLADSLGMSYANLGMPASSVYDMMASLMVYVRKYGKPKAVAALLPGYQRISLPVVYKHHVTNNGPDYGHTQGVAHINLAHRAVNQGEIVKYSKRPHNLEDLITYEMAMQQSMSALAVIIEYCRAAGIKFVFSTWNMGMEELLELKLSHKGTGVDMSGYVPVFSKLEVMETCHLEEKQRYEDIWVKARDCGNHMGAHEHIHYAKEFERRIKRGDGQ